MGEEVRADGCLPACFPIIHSQADTRQHWVGSRGLPAAPRERRRGQAPSCVGPGNQQPSPECAPGSGGCRLREVSTALSNGARPQRPSGPRPGAVGTTSPLSFQHPSAAPDLLRFSKSAPPPPPRGRKAETAPVKLGWPDPGP